MNFSDLSVHPGFPGPFLDIDDLFPLPMAVGVAWASLFSRHHLDESKRYALGFEFSVRDKLADETAGGLSPRDLILVYLSK